MMVFVRQFCREGRLAILALAGWLAVYGAAWAAPALPEKSASPELNSSVYVLAYFIVIFGIALGMLLVCRSSNRRDRAKPEQFGESKLDKKEE